MAVGRVAIDGLRLGPQLPGFGTEPGKLGLNNPGPDGLAAGAWLFAGAALFDGLLAGGAGGAAAGARVGWAAGGRFG